MKYSTLLPQVALVFAVAYACSDSTAPPNSRSLLVPKDPTAVVEEPPPPPVDATVVVCVSGCVVLEGDYFSNGADAALSAAIAKQAAGEGECVFPGTAWLKFDKNPPPQQFDVTNTANARIKCSHQIASGHGTIEWQAFTVSVVVNLEEVLFFDNPPECSTFCGNFESTATANGFPATAEGFIFNRDFYNDVFCPGEGGGTPVCTPER
jgi:hypothetical protein